MTAAERSRRWVLANRVRNRRNQERWRRANLDKVRQYKRKCYLKRQAHYVAWRKAYYERVKGREIAVKKEEIAACADSYMVQLLRQQGVLEPTREQIQGKRVAIFALRSQRMFKLMTYARLGKQN